MQLQTNTNIKRQHSGKKRPPHYALRLGIVMLFSSAGCGMMQKVDRERLQSEQFSAASRNKDSLSLQGQHTASHFRLEQSDSSAATYVLEIWPKGTFSIRNGNEFIGEAEKVRVHGRHSALQKQLLVADSSHTTMKLEQLQTAQQQLESHRSKALQVKKHPAWGWALILLALAVGLDLAYTLYKKRRRLTAEPPSL
jgi:hypothetical protein